MPKVGRAARRAWDKPPAPLHPLPLTERPHAEGKFIYAGGRKLYVRGVTYGTFAPNHAGDPFPDPLTVDRDFAAIAGNGMNAVRVYTVPPGWLLDCAYLHGLMVMVGLPWEQHVSFLDDRARVRSIEARVRAGVRACAGHPAVLCYAIGNEIPASIVRWYGRGRVECFLRRLYQIAKAEDPTSLVTYVNYPTTEYLRLPFVDMVCFNVYLESEERLDAYLARLHNIAGDRPLLLGEIGLDSRRDGQERQAASLDLQVRTAFGAGCAGAFVFAWTDEWYRDHAVLDWDFGLTDRARRPKPALAAVRTAYAEAIAPPNLDWPRISVVVCSHNGERTMRDCCRGLQALEYPDFEVIVVDDGSTDRTAAIAESSGLRVIRTENRGLSAARNTGLAAATGTIIAYLDDDAYPDPHWLTYLARTFQRTDHAGVGGPNLAPHGAGSIAECVANAPGGPIHVLLSDTEAEHIPGCNMAFRKECLEAIGGFDPQFRVAGDDVDICWRLQKRGWTLGFSPAAVVWHHRRGSVRAYWRQQRGYGKAEALLERKWPEKYNAAGHVTWNGRLYGRGLARTLGWQRERIVYGTWGSAPFQSAYHTTPGLLPSLLLLPEWHILSVGLAALSILGMQWHPLLIALPLFLLTAGASLIQALVSAWHARFTGKSRTPGRRALLHLLTAALFLLQPIARMHGRRWAGLCRVWQSRATGGAVPGPRTFAIWSEQWEAPHTWLYALEAALRMEAGAVLRGGDLDRWDVEARRGRMGIVRVRMASEEHGQGKQRLLFRISPYYALPIVAVIGLFLVLSLAAALAHSWLAASTLGLTTLGLGLATGWSDAAATAAVLRALQVVDRAARERVTVKDAWRPPSHYRLKVIAGRGGEVAGPRMLPGRPPSGRLTRHDTAR